MSLNKKKSMAISFATIICLLLSGCKGTTIKSNFEVQERNHSAEKVFDKVYKEEGFIGKTNVYTSENKEVVVETVVKGTKKFYIVPLLLAFDHVQNKLRTNFDVHVKVLKSSDYDSCTKTFKRDGEIRGKWYDKCNITYDHGYYTNGMGTQKIENK